MQRMLTAVGAVALVLFTSGSSRAETPPDPHTRPRWSITSNVAFLILPVVNASAEYRLGSSSAVSARAGVGRVTVDVPIGDDETNTVVELGGGYRYYLWGGFERGAFVGADVRYVDAGSGALLNVEQALCVGGVVGYKHVLSFGLTFDLRLGGALAFGEADAVVVPTIFLGAGWSF